MSQRKCKWCGDGISYIKTQTYANHVRWCKDNPHRAEYKNCAANGTAQLITKEAITKKSATISIRHKEGRYKNVVRRTFNNYRHSIETRKLISDKAKKSNHRRLRKSTRNYTKLDGSIVRLDSSWEELLAKRLDELCVDWIIPSPIQWLKGKYFPDFYLPDFDLYLDPKNPYALLSQIEKVTWLRANVKNLIILETIEEIMKFVPVMATSSKR